MPDGPGLELIMAELNRAHPGAVLDTAYDREQAALIVDPDHVLAVLSWLRDTPGQEYGFLSSLHAADYLPAEPRFAVHYELLNRARYERIRVKALLPDPASGNGHHSTGIDGRAGGGGSANGTGTGGEEGFGGTPGSGPSAGLDQGDEVDSGLGGGSGTGGEEGFGGTPGSGPSAGLDQGDEVDSGGAPGEGRPTGSTSSPDTNGSGSRLLPEIDSCVHLFPTADFQEREVFDFFGIVFRGHPDLRRMFMPEDYGGHPQRRDFPIGGEPVIFTRDEPSDPGWWR